MNKYEQELAEENADEEQQNYDVPDTDNMPSNMNTGNMPSTSGGNISSGDTHPHLAQYDNVSKMH